MTSTSPQAGDRIPSADPSMQAGRRQRDVMTAADLTPAFIRDRMATAGCYGDGITPPTEPCEHAPEECAAALARAVGDQDLLDAAARYDAAPHDTDDDDGITEVVWAVLRLAADERARHFWTTSR